MEYAEHIPDRSQNKTFEESNLMQRVLHRPVEPAGLTGDWHEARFRVLDFRAMGRFLFGALSLFFVSNIPSFGCDCGPPDHASRYMDEASIVFVGKVVFTNDDGSGKFTQKTLVRFEVEEAFKGLAPGVHDVWIDPGSFTSCHAVYRLGERDLVFGYGGAISLTSPVVSVLPRQSKPKPLPPGIDPKNPPKVYLAPECSGTREITSKTRSTVSPEIEYLRKVRKPVNAAQ